jgi:hypothetical protein
MEILASLFFTLFAISLFVSIAPVVVTEVNKHRLRANLLRVLPETQEPEAFKPTSSPLDEPREQIVMRDGQKMRCIRVYPGEDAWEVKALHNGTSVVFVDDHDRGHRFYVYAPVEDAPDTIESIHVTRES